MIQLSTGDMLREAGRGRHAGRAERPSALMDARRAGQRRHRQRADRRAARRRTDKGAIFDGFPRTDPRRRRSTSCSPNAGAARPCDRARRRRRGAGERITGRFTCAMRRRGYHDTFRPKKIDGRLRRLRLDRVQAAAGRNEQTVRTRMAEYRAKTAPILPFLRGPGGWSAASTAWRRSTKSRPRSTPSSTGPSL